MRFRMALLAVSLLVLGAAGGCGDGDEGGAAPAEPLNEVFESQADRPVRFSGIELPGDLPRVFIKVNADPVGGVAGESTLDCERSGARVQSHPGFGSPRTPFVQKIDLKGRPAVEGTSDCELSGSVKVQNGGPDGRLTVTVTDEP